MLYWFQAETAEAERHSASAAASQRSAMSKGDAPWARAWAKRSAWGRGARLKRYSGSPDGPNRGHVGARIGEGKPKADGNPAGISKGG